MIRGTARQTRMVHVPAEPRFRSAGELVYWHLTQGRASFGGARAIQYDRAGSHRDAFAARRGQALFALTTLCLDAVSDERYARALALCLGLGWSLERTASAIGFAETTTRIYRNRGLREVDDMARRLNRRASEPGLIGRPLVPGDDR